MFIFQFHCSCWQNSPFRNGGTYYAIVIIEHIPFCLMHLSHVIRMCSNNPVSLSSLAHLVIIPANFVYFWYLLCQ